MSDILATKLVVRLRLAHEISLCAIAELALEWALSICVPPHRNDESTLTQQEPMGQELQTLEMYLS